MVGELRLWGTVHSNEYHTDFWLDESVLIQIGENQYNISRIEIDDPYLFPTMISGKPISECDGNHLFLTGTITCTSEDFSLVKFYTLREAMPGETDPYSDSTSVYEDEVSTSTVCVTGVIEHYEHGWFISLVETLAVEDANGTVNCDALYFYEDTLNGSPISNFDGVTVILEGTPENYRDAGTFYLNNPVLIDVFTQPPAEYDELPVQNCIYCGGVARSVSGAWCCDNCGAVY